MSDFINSVARRYHTRTSAAYYSAVWGSLVFSCIIPGSHGGADFVLPALVPSMSYADLDGVAEGGEASRVFAAIVHGVYTGREADDYRQQLLDYCEQDTLAMVEIQKVLLALCGADSASA